MNSKGTTKPASTTAAYEPDTHAPSAADIKRIRALAASQLHKEKAMAASSLIPSQRATTNKKDGANGVARGVSEKKRLATRRRGKK